MGQVIAPGGVIGIIGGGQLGRMTALSAANLGYKVHIYTPEKRSPASQVAYATTVAEYTDEHALRLFAENVDVVTLEFENIPHESVQALSSLVEVCPEWEALHVSQNRIREKDFINELGIDTAPYQAVDSLASFMRAVEQVGRPAVLKTVELGYDGKGQYFVKPETDLSTLWDAAYDEKAAQDVHWVLEGFIDFVCEISVVVARGKEGEVLTYVPAENVHRDGMLRVSTVPASVSDDIVEQAQGIAKTISEALSFIGVMAVEFFVGKDGGLLVNEIAPRPHNSGHWTMDGCVTSQFEQHVRCVCGLPLGSVKMTSAIEMLNLVGDEVCAWEEKVRDPAVKLHIYGKEEIRKGRKMGHVNRLIF